MPAPRPRQTAVTRPDYTISVDGNQYVLKPGTIIQRVSLGEAQAGSLVHKPPFAMGQRYNDRSDPQAIWYERNANTMFTDITRGPQKQACTGVALPDNVIYNWFKKVRSSFFMGSTRDSLVAGQTATKLYFHNATDDRGLTGLPTGEFTFTPATIRTMNPSIGASQASLASGSLSESGVAFGHFAGPPLAAQTIAAQNWTLKIAREATDLTGEHAWGMRLYAFRPSTQAVVGYIVGSATTSVDNGTGSENTSSNTEQAFTGSAFSGSAVTVQDGDVLVCEIHAEEQPGGSAVAFTGTLYFDGTSETGADNATVSDYASNIASTNNLTMSGTIPAKVAGRLRYLTATTSFTDTTADGDTGLNYCQRVVSFKERLLALSAFPYGATGGQDMKALAQSQDGLVWSETNLRVQNQFLLIDMVELNDTLYLLYVNDLSYPTKWTIYSLAEAVFTGSTASAITAGTKVIEVSTNALPFGMDVYPDVNGVLRLWVFTAEGLGYVSDEDASGVWSLLRGWGDTASGYSGFNTRTAFHQNQHCIVAQDGGSLFQHRWKPGGTGSLLETINNGPKASDIELPEEFHGPVTAWASNESKSWFATAIAGHEASKKASIIFHRPKPISPTVLQDETISRSSLNCPYQNSTANRVIYAMGFTEETDGVSKLYFSESDGTQSDIWVFTYITEEPTSVTNYPYTDSSGGAAEVAFSETKPLGGLQDAGWGPVQVEARSLSAAAKYVAVESAREGGSLNTLQAITSSVDPPQVWPDQTGSGAGVGVAGRTQRVVVHLYDTGGANTTTGPTLLDVTETWTWKPLTPEGNPMEEIAFELDLVASAGRNRMGNNPKNAWDALRVSAAKNTLVALILPGGETVYVTMQVSGEFEPQARSPGNQAPAGGTATVRAWRLVR